MDNQPVIDYNPTEATPEDIAQLILDLRKEKDEGIIDERVLDFLQNLEDSVNTAGPVGDDQLDAVAGGFGGKRLGALAAAATMLLSGLGGSTMAAGKVSTDALYDQRDAVNARYEKGEISKAEWKKQRDILDTKLSDAYQRNMAGTFEGAAKVLKFGAGIGGAVFFATMLARHGSELMGNIKSGYMSVSNSLKNFWLRHTSKAIDIKLYETVLGRIESRLKKELVGQDEAIKQIINSMRGYFESVTEAQARGKKFEGGMILYLTGLPGTGKSTAMKIIGEEMGL